MILHAIELTHVGPFRQHTVRVGPFGGELNVIAAVNESGKSVAMNAAARALFDKHTTKDSEIKSLKPAGTDLAPKVSVEFDAGDGRYRIEKTFLQSPRSVLLQWQGGAWQPLAEADAADQRVQGLLNSTLPGRGATSPAHWGFLGFLWARQGEPAQWPDLDDDTGQKIRHRLARVEIDSVIEGLRSRLASIADSIITATGQAKTGGQLKSAEDDLAVIEAELLNTRDTREQLESQHKSFDSLTAEVAQLAIEHVGQKQRADELSQHAQKAERLKSELERHRSELEAAKDRLQTVANDADALARHRSELAAGAEAAAPANAAVVSATAAVENVRRRVDENQHQLPELESTLARLNTERQRSQDLLRLHQERTQSDQIGKLLKKVTDAAAKLVELRKKRDGLPEVTAAKLRRIDELSSGIRDLQVQVQALGLTVELTPDRDTEIVVADAGKPDRHAIRKQQTKILQRPQVLDLQLAGWGRALVRSGAKEARELTSELAEKNGTLRKSLLDAQVATIDAARDAVAARRDFDAQIKAAEAALVAQLGESASVDDLQRAHTSAVNQVAALEKSLRPTKNEQALSATELEGSVEKLGAAIKTADASMKTIGKKLDALRTEERGAITALQARTQQLNDLRSKQRTLEARINDVLTRYPAGSDTAKALAQKVFVEAEARYNTTKAQLPPDFKKLPERNRRAAAALEQLAGDIQSKRAARDAAKGALETLGGQGLYSRETDLLERREEAAKRRDAARSRGWAARIAHDLIEYRKQAATKAVLAPLEQRLSAAFSDITGNAERKVFLDENLQIAGIGPTREQAISFDQLSQGAKEQLLLCLRLAVAQELVATEPQVLILDDVLVNTDPIRQERVLDVLGAATRHLQIVILTCHPDRYRGVGQVLALTPAPPA